VDFQLIGRWVPIIAPVVPLQPPSRKGKVSISPIILHEIFAPTVFDASSLHYMRISFCIHHSFAHVLTWLVTPCGLKDLVQFGQVYVLFWFRLSASVTLIWCTPILLFTAISLYSCTMFLMLLCIGLTCTGLLIISLHLSLSKVSLLGICKITFFLVPVKSKILVPGPGPLCRPLVLTRVYLDIFQRITMIHVEKFQEKSVFLFFEL